MGSGRAAERAVARADPCRRSARPTVRAPCRPPPLDSRGVDIKEMEGMQVEIGPAVIKR